MFNRQPGHGLYHGVLDSKKINAFVQQFKAGLITDRFLRIAAQHIIELEAQVAEQDSRIKELETKKKSPKKEDKDAS